MTGASRRYAKALLDVAARSGDPASVRRELREIGELLARHRDLHRVLSNPSVPPPRRRALLEAVLNAVAGAPVSDLMRRLLGLLVERNRIVLLADIERAFAELWNTRRNVVSATATTALPLSSEQRSALEGAIRTTTGRDVEIQEHIDPGVLGGAKVDMEGRTYDGTVAARLEALRRTLTRPAAG